MIFQDIVYKISFNIKHPEKLMLNFLDRIVNTAIDLKRGRVKHEWRTHEGHTVTYSKRSNAITEHLNRLYELASSSTGLILELGTNAGGSTRAFLAGSKGKVISIDIQDFSNAVHDLPKARKENWNFICGPDVDVAVRLRDEIARLGWDDDVDILFIDTTHEYEHTFQELKAYIPFLNSRSKIVLHDSNLAVVYRRKDGSFGFGFDNKRGVARAVEAYFNITFDEKRPYLNEVVNSLVIDHTPYSCGLTVISSLNNWGKGDN